MTVTADGDAQSTGTVTTDGASDPFRTDLFNLTRKRRAIVYADIVESVRLIEEDEERTIKRWLRLVDGVSAEILPELNGEFVRSVGDGMLLVFPDVRSAIRACFAIQEMAEAANADVPEAAQIHLRIGLEESELLADDRDVYGHGVNLSARLAGLAGPGEICLSADAREQLTDGLDADIEDLGERFVRHVSESVRVYRVKAPDGPAVTLPALDQTDLRPAVAVVPFANNSGSPMFDSVGEVLADHVIRQLSRQPELRVTSRLTTTAFRGRDESYQRIASRLDAQYILSGSYQIDGTDIGLVAELAEGATGQVIWSDRLTDGLNCLTEVDIDLVDRLIAEIQRSILARELVKCRYNPLNSLEHYTLMLGAITLMHRLSQKDFNLAHEMLTTLIDRSGRRPLPLAWLGMWHVLKVQQGWSADPEKDSIKALESTSRALDLDPEFSLAMTIDGLVHTNLLHRLDTAERRYEEALSFNPNEPRAHLLLGTLKAFRGEGADAVKHTLQSINLTPLDPHLYFYYSLTATAHLAAEDYEGALAFGQESLRANRSHTSTLRAIAVAQWNLGRNREARETAAHLMSMEPNLTVSGWLARSPAEPYQIGKDWANTLLKVGIPN